MALSAVEIVLTTKAVVDLVRRPREQIRGPKTLWALGFTVQPFGPIAYLALAPPLRPRHRRGHPFEPDAGRPVVSGRREPREVLTGAYRE